MALLLGGCAVTSGEPVFEMMGASDRVVTATSFRNGSSVAQAVPPRGDWWLDLADAELQKLVQSLDARNFDLVAARYRITQAAAIRRQVASELFPSVGASLSGSVDGRETNDDWDWSEAFSAGINVDWTLDVFGGVRSGVEAENLRLMSQMYAAEDLRHSLIASLVSSYIQGWAATERLQIAQALVDSYEQSLYVTESRYESGSALVSALDVALARQNLAAARADIPELEAQSKLISHSIDILVGAMPGETKLTYADIREPERFEEISTGVPGDLLLRRPDVRLASLQYEAALYDVRAAEAMLLPNFSLSASAGSAGSRIEDLFDPDRLAATLLASLTAPIFQSGRLQAQAEQSQERAKELSANYSGTVLQAVFEVEEALILENANRQTLVRAGESLEAAILADQLSQERYTSGQVDLLTVIEARRALNSARLSVLSAKLASLDSRLSLFAALGGDWRTADENTVQ